jgi:hypothetical protein
MIVAPVGSPLPPFGTVDICAPDFTGSPGHLLRMKTMTRMILLNAFSFGCDWVVNHIGYTDGV